jgi:integrase
VDIKTLQANLGHHSAAFTLDRYGHVTEQMKDEGANKIQAYYDNLKTHKG